MIFLRKKLKTISLFLSFLVLFASCTQFDDSSNITENNEKLDFNGKQLFKSIYFGTGEFAKNIYQLERLSEVSKGISENEKIKFEEKIDNLIQKIDETNPLFFNNFKLNISSGNHQLIQQTIQEGAFVMQENIEIIFPELKKVIAKVKEDVNSGKLKFEKNEGINDYEKKLTEAFNNKEYDELLKSNMITGEAALVPCTWAVACVVYFAIAAHNTVAVTALIYFKVAFWGPSIDKKNNVNGNIAEGSDSLNTELLINEIAEFYEAKNDN